MAVGSRVPRTSVRGVKRSETRSVFGPTVNGRRSCVLCISYLCRIRVLSCNIYDRNYCYYRSREYFPASCNTRGCTVTRRAGRETSRIKLPCPFFLRERTIARRSSHDAKLPMRIVLLPPEIGKMPLKMSENDIKNSKNAYTVFS